MIKYEMYTYKNNLNKHIPKLYANIPLITLNLMKLFRNINSESFNALHIDIYYYYQV